jgi:hypothetical protein
MDLGRFLQVAWRFKLLLAVGFSLATVVALLAYASVSPSGITPRETETWRSASTLLVTQEGFPWGRAILDETVPLSGTRDANGDFETVPRFGDPGRYSGLAALYAELAKADEVQAEVAKGAKPGQYYESMVVQQPGTTSALPMIYIMGYGPTPDEAIATAERASKAFIEYMDKEQTANKISDSKRVEVVVTKAATTPEIFEKRSFVRPIMLFLLISLLTLATAFGLENLRPRPRAPQPIEDEFAELQELWPPEREPTPARRSA